ncbi:MULTISPECIES: LysR family transcriptional regulator [Tatumella]|uniref:LysR family transcriptional regulator n=1 Tax=Tatumella punctata TaxID=399969 RepID=A0ABW1VMM8_9GAMM|nr:MULTISPECIES: LysR family transcriptional regulator [unclassified Tatumella]MBS0855489.1 LysR family transcriptional regulator [Tatumella sp. JGM16]MBS0877129.1 LysR family transcriptional regulator [Tatumella sp. JGM82]MBS0890603.1 LysR family transcriptional regulator [Tatumella sp. JGM94]MBS0893276.1 LysR family transcriptional regulator [Tatumella sp. JGM130]MBS0901432.1 LysR family transcriptional regulator [Tatumella sp. JGM100]
MQQGENITAMYIFCRVAEQQSFSHAAKILGISTASVSREIAALEKRLAIKLLQRTTRKVTVTECGRLYYRYCQRISEQLEQADDFIRQMHRQPTGQVRLMTPVTYGCQCIVPLLQTFMQQHIHVRIDLDLSDREPDMAQDDIDVAIVVRQRPPDYSRVRPLSAIHWGLYAAPQYLTGHAPVIRPRDINRHQLLTFHGQAHQAALCFRKDKKRVEINAVSRLRANNSMALLTAACAGAGIACLPSYMVHQALADGSLQPVLPGWQLPSYHSYLLLKQPAESLSAVSLLCDMLAEKLSHQ